MLLNLILRYIILHVFPIIILQEEQDRNDNTQYRAKERVGLGVIPITKHHDKRDEQYDI